MISQLMQAAYRICNRNNPLFRRRIWFILPAKPPDDYGFISFDSLDYNVVYAQMGRGKMERTVAFAMAGIAATLSS